MLWQRYWIFFIWVNGGVSVITGKPCDTLVELCIGCNVSVSDVKLVKFCDPRDCGNCFCRPMWCVTCLSKWFAARQDQTNPHTWLQGTAPCPTCRSKFCMLDVCLIARPVENASDEQWKQLERTSYGFGFSILLAELSIVFNEMHILRNLCW